MITRAVHPSERGAVVFDFDGTVCLGDAPALAYAEACLARIPSPGERDRVRASIERWFSGEEDASHADAYGAIRTIIGHRLDATQFSNAYLESRCELADDPSGVRAPDGLVDLLRRLGDFGCDRVLLTNSPAIGMPELLGELGVDKGFDQVVVDADKPRRMAEHLESLARDVHPHRVASVGDHWANDVRPAVEMGCVGMLITGSWGATDTGAAADDGSGLRPDVTATSLAELVPHLLAFAERSVSLAPDAVGAGR